MSNARIALKPSNTIVVVLHYRGLDDTIACLEALLGLDEQPRRVVIIDNGSGDGSEEALKRWLEARSPSWGTCGYQDGFSSLRIDSRHLLVPLDENIGYASGNNVGIRLAMQDPECQAIWILNNDTEPYPDALDSLCRFMNEHLGLGAVGSTLVYAHAPDIVQCAGGFLLNRWLGTTRAILGGTRLEDLPETYEAPCSPWYISGASLYVRREVFDKTALFSDSYFLYYEDTEFSLRLRRCGYDIGWARESRVRHKEGGSSGATTQVGARAFSRPPAIDYFSLRNRVYVMRDYFPQALPLVVMSFCAVLLKRISRGQIDRIPLVLRALRDGLFSGRHM